MDNENSLLVEEDVFNKKRSVKKKVETNNKKYIMIQGEIESNRCE